MSIIYKLGPNQEHTIQLDVDQMACRVRLSVDGRLELDKQVLDRLVYAFRLSASQKVPVRFVAELSDWHIEAGLFAGPKQIPPVNGQLADLRTPGDPDAENEPIGADTDDVKLQPVQPRAQAVDGPDEMMAAYSQTPEPVTPEPDEQEPADDGHRAMPASELPVLGSEAAGYSPPDTTTTMPPAAVNPLAGPTIAGGPSAANIHPARRRRVDLTNPGILACMIMAVLNLGALILTQVTGLVTSEFFTMERWMIMTLAGTGLAFLLLAFAVALRSMFCTYFAIVLTGLHMLVSMVALVWLAVLMAQNNVLEVPPLLLLTGLLIREVVCLVLLSRGLVRLRRWWA